ncbi:hypothetical protein PV458_29415 [Streptomyces sp. MN03-5084-2B]|nr:hypothetical protein [Streptomyces sp. MN03-5084-2B]
MRQNLSFSTRRLYTQHVRDYLKPYLGSVPLRSLTVARVQAMFAALIRTNTSRTRPLSYATLQRIQGVLHAALNGSIRRGLIERNPAHWVELPSGRRPRAVVWTEGREAHWRQTGEHPAVAVWTATQTAAFLESSFDHPMHVLYLLVALLGLRRVKRQACGGATSTWTPACCSCRTRYKTTMAGRWSAHRKPKAASASSHWTAFQ